MEIERLLKTGKILLNVEEVAAILGISPRSIYNSIHRRAAKPFPIRPKRVGRLIRFSVKDVNDYIDSI
jgi:excisionase family DNA binding protein